MITTWGRMVVLLTFLMMGLAACAPKENPAFVTVTAAILCSTLI